MRSGAGPYNFKKNNFNFSKDAILANDWELALSVTGDDTIEGLLLMGDYEKAKKKYLQAKEIYKELQEEDKASQVDNRIDMLHAEKEEKEKEQEQEQEQGGSQLPGQIQSQMQGQGQGLNGTGQNGNGQLPPVQITVSGNATFNPHE